MPARYGVPQITMEEMADYLGSAGTAALLWAFNWPAGAGVGTKPGMTDILIGAGAAALGAVGATMLPPGPQSRLASGVASGSLAYLGIMLSQAYLGKGFASAARANYGYPAYRTAYQPTFRRVVVPPVTATRSALEI